MGSLTPGWEEVETQADFQHRGAPSDVASGAVRALYYLTFVLSVCPGPWCAYVANLRFDRASAGAQLA